MKNLVLLLSVCALMFSSLWAAQVRVAEAKGGGVANFVISGDAATDWLVKTDGSQYPWIGSRYQWGNGYFEIDGQRAFWQLDGAAKTRVGGVEISVTRQSDGEDILERYTFTNKSAKDLDLTNIGIFTPFNDNYPGALICMTNRCHAHIWTGGRVAWVKAMRMNGKGPHLGLILCEGSIDDYDQWERAHEKAMSHTRGILALAPSNLTLKPGESASLAWRIFAHQGDDFEAQLLKRGGMIVSSDKYVCEVGETAHVSFSTAKGTETLDVVMDKPGEKIVSYAETKAVLWGVSKIDDILSKRAAFILARQQMNDPTDPRDGAFMIYDNETDSLVTKPGSRHDLSAGRERLGMGCFLAEYLRRHPDPKAQAVLVRYAKFVREKLQKPDYTTLSGIVTPPWDRGYNYAWVADFYFRLYELTKNVQYARDGYETLQALYRGFGHGFYCVGYPVRNGLAALQNAGLTSEYYQLLSDFRKTADIFMHRGFNMPKIEVNYEQSIVAPAVQVLCDVYLATRDEKYLSSARALLPLLEAFAGSQPHYRLNDIGLRHWDGYWFGKRQEYGDVFPHHWSAITAAVFLSYAEATGDTTYQKRAEQIVRNNLCQFFEDGRASCAHLFPRQINGNPAAFTDAYANDQDWALVQYYMVYR